VTGVGDAIGAVAAAAGGTLAPAMRGGMVALGDDGAGFAAAAAGAGAATGAIGAAAAAAAAATGTGSAGRVVPHWTQNLAPGCVS
jgi:hypothetical protein